MEDYSMEETKGLELSFGPTKEFCLLYVVEASSSIKKFRVAGIYFILLFI